MNNIQKYLYKGKINHITHTHLILVHPQLLSPLHFQLPELTNINSLVCVFTCFSLVHTNIYTYILIYVNSVCWFVCFQKYGLMIKTNVSQSMVLGPASSSSYGCPTDDLPDQKLWGRAQLSVLTRPPEDLMYPKI